MVTEAGRGTSPETGAPASRLKTMVWTVRTELKAMALAAM